MGSPRVQGLVQPPPVGSRWDPGRGLSAEVQMTRPQQNSVPDPREASKGPSPRLCPGGSPEGSGAGRILLEGSRPKAS